MGFNLALHSLRSVLPFGNQQDIDTAQLDPIAKVVLGVAKVIFEVRALYWRIKTRGNA